MKSLIHYFWIPIFFFLVGCDKIDTPLEETEQITTQIFTDSSVGIYDQNKQIVLFEEFTGHTCQQCPAGNIVLQDILSLYPDQTCAIAYHAGFFAQTQQNTDGSYSTDFTTQTTEELADFFGVTLNPVCLVNRTAYNGETLLGVGAWEPSYNQNSLLEPEVQIQLKSYFSDQTQEVKIEAVLSQVLAPINGYKMQMFLMEDSIIDWQKDGPQDLPNYRHDHVFRKSLSGTWGAEITNIDSIYTFTGSLNTEWRSDKMYALSIFYDPNTQRVVQVNKVKINP